MATVKIKLRPSQVTGKAGVIFYQVTQNRKTRQITTKFRVHPAYWDADEQQLLPDAPNRSTIQPRIDGDVSLLRRIVAALEHEGCGYTVEDIIERYNSPHRHILVQDYMRTQIEQLQAANRLGTAKNYEKAMRSFCEFSGDGRLPLRALSEQIITDYNAFLIRRGLVRNSVSFYMRILRAIYNKAVRQKFIEQTHPFADVYTGIDRTRKRAVSESLIARLHRLKLPAGSSLALARDLFIFSYCTRGMAFVDIAYLRKENLRSGTICYTRRKTGQLLFIKIEPSIQRIINRYTDGPSPYVFPLLTSTVPAEAYKQYQLALNAHNRLLGKLSTMAGCDCKLTSYTSRHSWATAARNHNIPLSIISQGMGHSSEQTTQIYLTMLENSVIDDANNKIIRRLNY